MSDQSHFNSAPNGVDHDQNAQPGQQMQKKADPPVRTLRDGTLSSSIWQRQGQDGPFYTATIARNWRDEQGHWHSSYSFSENDLRRLPNLAKNTGDVMTGLRYEQSLVQEDVSHHHDDQRAAYQQKRAEADYNPAPQQRRKIRNAP